ncbi:MAG: hypothetical protein WKF30_06690 [Pyrinomonadaceae bacterium]
MSDLFTGFNTTLPTVTIVVVGVSHWLASNIFWFGPLAVAVAIGLYLWGRTPNGRLRLDGFWLKLPVVGNLVTQLAVAQVTRSLATLLAGGITLVESWEIASESITNRELRRRSSSILSMIREGRPYGELGVCQLDSGPRFGYGWSGRALGKLARDAR